MWIEKDALSNCAGLTAPGLPENDRRPGAQTGHGFEQPCKPECTLEDATSGMEQDIQELKGLLSVRC